MVIGSSSQRLVCLLLLTVSVLSAVPLLALSDAEMEACLAEGKILKGWEELVGLTRPIKLTLDCDGREQKAAFKSLEIRKWGIYVLANGEREFHFTDCYQYEVAAYRLDRELGLGMVPVAVLRRYRGTDGALVAWVSGTVHEDQVSHIFNGPETASLARRRSIVRMFDSLIYNMDRRPPNTLVDQSAARIYMIDHGRSFREKQELHEEFEQDRIWLSEATYSRLKALDKERLDVMLKGLVTKGQRKTLLVRRDLIIEKIDQDREEYGDEAVFVDPGQ